MIVTRLYIDIYRTILLSDVIMTKSMQQPYKLSKKHRSLESLLLLPFDVSQLVLRVNICRIKQVLQFSSERCKKETSDINMEKSLYCSRISVSRIPDFKPPNYQISTFFLKCFGVWIHESSMAAGGFIHFIYSQIIWSWPSDTLSHV